MCEVGLTSDEHLEGLLERGYNFSALEVSHETDLDVQLGCAILRGDDLHSIDSLIRQDAIQKFVLDVGYTQYHSITNVVVRGPAIQQHAMVFAQSILPVLRTFPYIELSIMLPLCPTPLSGAILDDEDESLSTWEIWDTIRSIANYHPRLHVALELPAKLPSYTTQQRWTCEDIRQVFISASIFLVNNKGYPVLPKAHQLYLQAACRYGPSLILQDVDRHQRLGGDDAYMQYVRYILKTAPEPPVAESFAVGYQDFLQQPLQPLQDNLASATYEVFERDPVKYAQYEKAILRALLDRPRGVRTAVAVVGAGRGPLVDCCLRASEDADTPIVLFAIEKNPHAVQGLQRRMANEWVGKVTLVETDMRNWEPEEYVDILVSELLGSFADNELSPECLDGVQHVLHPDTGISIPSRYTPYVTPLMTPKLFSSLRNATPEAKETPYVVLLSQCSHLSAQFEPLWHFHHPSDQTGTPVERQMRNKRYGKAEFQCPAKGVCHGIAGYFESILYADVELSTVPDTIDLKSPDMVSWFPIFFPLLKPIYIPAGANVEIHFWRETDNKKVWYEYMLEVWLGDTKIGRSDLINQGGLKNAIGL